jgi:hypothetical protein
MNEVLLRLDFHLFHNFINMVLTIITNDELNHSLKDFTD